MATGWRRVRECVFCPKGQNLNSLSISDSAYKCFRCNRTGHLEEYHHAKLQYKISPPTLRATPNVNSTTIGSSSSPHVVTPPRVLWGLPRLSQLMQQEQQSSSPQVVLITGKTGVGKTTLLNQLCVDSQVPALYTSLEQPLVRTMQSLLRLCPSSSAASRPLSHVSFCKGGFEELDFGRLVEAVRFAREAKQVTHVFVDALNRFSGGLEHNLMTWRQQDFASHVTLLGTVHPRSKRTTAAARGGADGDEQEDWRAVLDSAMRDLFLADAWLVLQAVDRERSSIQLVDSAGRACGEEVKLGFTAAAASVTGSRFHETSS